MKPLSDSITIRPAYADDHSAVARLAALDSAEQLPRAPLLLAEVDGEPRAALSLLDGAAVADPFFPTRHLLSLMRAHAAASAAPAPSRRHRRAHRLGFA